MDISFIFYHKLFYYHVYFLSCTEITDIDIGS